MKFQSLAMKILMSQIKLIFIYLIFISNSIAELRVINIIGFEYSIINPNKPTNKIKLKDNWVLFYNFNYHSIINEEIKSYKSLVLRKIFSNNERIKNFNSKRSYHLKDGVGCIYELEYAKRNNQLALVMIEACENNRNKIIDAIYIPREYGIEMTFDSIHGEVVILIPKKYYNKNFCNELDIHKYIAPKNDFIIFGINSSQTEIYQFKNIDEFSVNYLSGFCGDL